MARDEDTVVYMTKGGKKITAEMVEKWSAEAELGYSLDQLTARARREPSADARGLASTFNELHTAFVDDGMDPDVAIKAVTAIIKSASESEDG